MAKTIFLLKKSPTGQGVEKTRGAIYEAIINGKFYPVRQGQTDDYRLVLDEFSILDSSGNKAVSGDVIEVQGNPQISVKVSATPPRPPSNKGGVRGELVEVQLIRKGEVIQKFSGETPLEINFNDDLKPPSPLFDKGGKEGVKEGEMIYYRLSISGKRPNYIMSNPIFVKLLPGLPPQKEESPSIPSPLGGEGQGEGEKSETKASHYIIIEKVSAVRTGPGVEYEKIGRVDKGERLEIISVEEKLFKGEPWYKVKYMDKECFVWGGLARKE